MCEFCLKHGEGEKWYLRAGNYSDDLLSDVRRRKFIEDFIGDVEGVRMAMDRLDRLSKVPKLIRDIVAGLVTRKMKKVHFGQIVPIEEIEEILSFVNSIIRVACLCRHVTIGREKRYCYAVSLGPDGGKFSEIIRGVDTSFLNGPDAAENETLTRDEAIAAIRAHETEGLCHSVWTFHTPFIAAICNCDRSDCLAMHTTITHGMAVMFRGEYVAEVDADACTGCRNCMCLCQFGAMGYSASKMKVFVDQRWCYGCGICRSACRREAITLKSRAAVPAAKDLW